MDLRKINDRLYVNVGTGNILYVSMGMGDDTVIFFLGGNAQTVHKTHVEDVVKLLRNGVQ